MDNNNEVGKNAVDHDAKRVLRPRPTGSTPLERHAAALGGADSRQLLGVDLVITVRETTKNDLGQR